MNPEYARKMMAPTAERHKIPMDILSASDADAIRTRAQDIFSGSVDALTSETLGHGARLTRPQSWELLTLFEHNSPVLVFTNWRSGEAMFRFSSLGDALTVLGESPPFDFYLIDPDYTFLFAHDEYENLFGCGTASSFVIENGGEPFGVIS